jgi:hypothetical protein
MVTSTSVRSGRMSPHRMDDDGAASRQGSQSMCTESSFQRRLREAVRCSMESYPFESHPQDPPPAAANPASGSNHGVALQSSPDAQFSPSLSNRSAINHRSPSDPDPFSPVSVPPTLLPTPEPTYVPSKPKTNRMVDNGYWRAITETPPPKETPPQDASGTPHWSPPPSVSRTVKNMETQMDAASQ